MTLCLRRGHPLLHNIPKHQSGKSQSKGCCFLTNVLSVDSNVKWKLHLQYQIQNQSQCAYYFRLILVLLSTLCYRIQNNKGGKEEVKAGQKKPSDNVQEVPNAELFLFDENVHLLSATNPIICFSKLKKRSIPHCHSFQHQSFSARELAHTETIISWLTHFTCLSRIQRTDVYHLTNTFSCCWWVS